MAQVRSYKVAFFMLQSTDLPNGKRKFSLLMLWSSHLLLKGSFY